MQSNCQHPGSVQVLNVPGFQVPARLSNCAHWRDAREGWQYVSFAPPKEESTKWQKSAKFGMPV